MVRKKKLSPSGQKDKDGNYNNAHINIHRDELEASGLEIGDEVFVRVRGGMLVIQKTGKSEDIQHKFRENDE
ncbi:MAG: hypothetical protein ABEJ99_05190 [Candidatus Nanohaloarchaea archaeon]